MNKLFFFFIKDKYENSFKRGQTKKEIDCSKKKIS
jgi:hypothetical protein